MTKVKLPHELSLDELLKSVAGEEKPKDGFSFNNPILSFVQEFKISPGTNKVSDKLLYKLFRSWFKEDFISQRTFNIRLGSYIPSAMRNRRYYLVNTKTLELAKKCQLLEESQSLDRSKSIHWNKHYESFLRDTGLTEGPIYVEADILFYIYNNWCDRTRKTKKLGSNTFSAITKLNFEKKNISNSDIAWFGVNNKVKELITREEVKRWRQGRKKYGKKQKIKDEEKKDHSAPREANKKDILYPKKNKKRSSKV